MILLFSVIYYQMYLHEKTHFRSEYTELTYGHFLWYSVMINFTMPMSDILPYTNITKVITGLQGFLFWFVMLS